MTKDEFIEKMMKLYEDRGKAPDDEMVLRAYERLIEHYMHEKRYEDNVKALEALDKEMLLRYERCIHEKPQD